MALTPLKLPRLQRRIDIVDVGRKPTDNFHRYLNEFAKAIEGAFNGQQVLLDQILAAQAAAAAAQVTADAALAAAEAAGGATYIPIVGGNPASNAAPAVPPGVLLGLGGTLDGATLDADSPLFGTLSLYESQGMSSVLVASAEVVVGSAGVQNMDLSWQTVSTALILSGVATFSGAVTYSVEVARTSGSNFINPGSITANLTFTNPAP